MHLLPILHRVCNLGCVVGFYTVLQLLWGAVGCAVQDAVLTCGEKGNCIVLS